MSLQYKTQKLLFDVEFGRVQISTLVLKHQFLVPFPTERTLKVYKPIACETSQAEMGCWRLGY